MSTNPHLGSTLDDFLEEEGIHEQVDAAAIKRVIALQIKDRMKASRISKTTLAKRMKTSRMSIDRLLDAESGSVTLNTLNKAASALGCHLKVELV